MFEGYNVTILIRHYSSNTKYDDENEIIENENYSSAAVYKKKEYKKILKKYEDVMVKYGPVSVYEIDIYEINLFSPVVFGDEIRVYMDGREIYKQRYIRNIKKNNNINCNLY